MKLNRLFEIVYILINKQQVTAKYLSEHFEVSTRTIYRDIDTLSQCGIPVYASKGKGGGISLVEGYKIDKAMLTKNEQTEILSALQSMRAADIDIENNALNKLSAFFNAGNTDWIEIDFSSFSASTKWKDNFEKIKQCIFNTQKIEIDYINLKGEKSSRIIEPIKMIFKNVSWYLYAYCQNKQNYRMFKLSRIININILDERFTPHINVNLSNDYNPLETHKEALILKVDQDYAYRIFDDFSLNEISKNTDGSYIVKTCTYDTDWIINYILSLGEKIECIEPLNLRSKIQHVLKKSLDKYLM